MHRTPLRLGSAALGAAALALLLVALVPAPAAAATSAAASGFSSSLARAGASDRDASPSIVPSPGSRSSPSAATLTAPGQTPSAISLAWTDGTSGTFENYVVEEASAVSNWTLGAVQTITAEATTSTVVAGISPSTPYEWQVVENYESCVLFLCTAESVDTNVLNLTQPPTAFLNDTGLTSTSVTLEWTNNATYGGELAFSQYQVFEQVNGGTVTPLTPITSESETSELLSLVSGDSYTLYLRTSDCAPGCTGSGLSVTQSNPITLGPPLSLSVTVSAQHASIDLGQSDLFTCTASGGEAPFWYNWSVEGSAYAPGSESQSFTLNATGAQSVQCRVGDPVPPAETGGTSVYVYPALSVIASVNRTAVDAGQSAGFVCYAVGGEPAYTLQWSFGDGMTSIVGNLSHSYGSAGAYAPSCFVSDLTGASGDPVFTLDVSPALLAVATVSSLDAAPGTSLNFVAQASNGSGHYTAYNWTFGGGGTATGSAVTHAFSTPGDVTVGLAITDSNGATAAATLMLDISYVTITADGPSTATAGTAVTFSAAASGGAGGPYNYTWSFGTGSVQYGASISHTFSSAGSFTPHLTVTDRLGATNETTLAAVSVASAPAPLSGFAVWLILGIGILVAVILAAVVVSRRRKAEAKEIAHGSPYVPPTNPSRTIKGRKVCPSCGASNLPVRSTCQNCGKPLPRSPG